MDLGRLNLAEGARSGGAAMLAAAGALALCAAFLLAGGHDPLRAAALLVDHALGSRDGIYETLTRAVPLALTGLGVALAFRGNVYNIGADGQLVIGALAGAAALQATGALGPLSLPWLLLASAGGGALYGAVAGWLRARFDANEIIVTIMLNYIAVQLLAWAVRGPMQEAARIFPRSERIPEAAAMPELVAGSLHGGVLIALAAAALLWLVVRRSVFGYQLDAVGENRAAAEYGGISPGRVIVLAMAASGGLCGLAGGVEVAGIFHRLEEGMAPGVGMAAIAVALLARLNPLLVPLSAIVFAVLVVGTAALQRQMGVPYPLVWIIEASVIFAFLLAGWRRQPQPARA
jgi:ABC-type uncharacterized transport system permease subunit